MSNPFAIFARFCRVTLRCPTSIGAVHADFVGEPLLADIVDGAQILDAQTDFYLKYVSHRRSVSWMLCI